MGPNRDVSGNNGGHDSEGVGSSMDGKIQVTKEVRCRVGRDSVTARPRMDNGASMAGRAVSPSSGSGGKLALARPWFRQSALRFPLVEREQQPQDLFCTAQLRLGGPDRKTFAATKPIVGGNRKRLTATNKKAEVHFQPQTLTYKKARLVLSRSRLNG